MGTRRREYIPKHQSRDGVRRHVWIYDKATDPTGLYPWPGLLLEWVKRGDEWWARVVFVPYPSEPGEAAVRWFPARALRVVEVDP